MLPHNIVGDGEADRIGRGPGRTAAEHRHIVDRQLPCPTGLVDAHRPEAERAVGEHGVAHGNHGPVQRLTAVPARPPELWIRDDDR